MPAHKKSRSFVFNNFLGSGWYLRMFIFGASDPTARHRRFRAYHGLHEVLVSRFEQDEESAGRGEVAREEIVTADGIEEA